MRPAAACAVALLLGGLAIAATAAPRPNILFILTDDLGYGDLGVYFQNSRAAVANRSQPWFATPKLDVLGSEGLQLTRHYCPAPVCAPSRASLLLGVHQGHANVRDNQFDKALENNHTLASVLKGAGYETAIIGKYGLQGTGSPAVAHPLYRGFDYFFGLLAHLDGHLHYPKEDGGHVYDNFAEITTNLDKCYSTDLFTARAKRWLQDHAATNAATPFFLYLAYDAPHARLEVPTQAYPAGAGTNGGLQWVGTPGAMINSASGTVNSWLHPDYASATWDDDNNGGTVEVAWPTHAKNHATMVRRLDDAVADLVQTLKDLNLDTNTLIVFTSDNGTHNEAGSGGSVTYNPTFFDSFARFDGIKRDCWEGGIRMPTLVRWPAGIAPARTNATPSAFWDWMPTFAELAGVPAPARTDGVSLVPTLTGSGTQRESTVYIEYNYAGTTPSYTEFNASHRGRTRNEMQVVVLGGYKGVRYNITNHTQNFEIYDPTLDTHEATNLAASLSSLQQRMKDRVLEVRRPGGGVSRPYDAEAVPGVTVTSVVAGLNYRAFEGAYPWTPDFSGLTNAAAGVCTNVDLSVRTRDDQIGLLYEGFLQVPQTGTYTFYLTPDSRSLLRLHDAIVVDADFGHTNGTEVSASINLAAGYHPFRLGYARATGGTPSVSLDWSGPAFARQAVPASALVTSGTGTPLAVVANPDVATTVRAAPVLVDVLANDMGGAGPLFIASVASPAAGSASIVSGRVQYAPSPGFLGRDTFAYVVSDGISNAPAGVTVEVCVPLTNTLWLPFDELGGDRVHDAGGLEVGAFSGIATSSAAWVGGRFGGALTFDGVDDQVNLAGVNLPAGAAPRTIACWIRSAATAGELQTFFGYGVNSNGQRFSCRLDTTDTNRELRLEVQGGFVVGTKRINDDQWHHVALAAADFDGNGTNNVAETRLYVDGVRETISTSSNRAINTVAGPVPTLGGSGHAANYGFSGTLDDFRLFPRALSDAEVMALATSRTQAAAAWYYRHHGTNASDWSADTDFDGYNTWLEWALAGEPGIADGQRRPHLLWPTGSTPGLAFSVPLAGTNEVAYALEASTNIAAWLPAVAIAEPGPSGNDYSRALVLRLTNTPPDATLYLRLRTGPAP